MVDDGCAGALVWREVGAKKRETLRSAVDWLRWSEVVEIYGYVLVSERKREAGVEVAVGAWRWGRTREVCNPSRLVKSQTYLQ